MRSHAKKPAGVAAGFSLTVPQGPLESGGRPIETPHLIAKPLSAARKEAEAPNAFTWEWRGAVFARVAPGIYTAVCRNVQGPEFVKAYGRWSLRIGFGLIADDVEVSAYYNMGRQRKPQITRSGRYFRTWCLVNGDLPARGQDMSPSLFLETGLLYEVEVEDALISAARSRKPEEAVYSRVKDILRVVYS